MKIIISIKSWIFQIYRFEIWRFGIILYYIGTLFKKLKIEYKRNTMHVPYKHIIIYNHFKNMD